MKNSKTILEYLKQTNTVINASCNGKGTCGRCKIKVNNRLLTPKKQDIQCLTTKQIDQGYRLACQHIYQEDDDIDGDDFEGQVLEDTVIETTIENKWTQTGYGIIVDIGTTTIVIKWIDVIIKKVVHVNSFYNPQATYGADVISRIQYDTLDNQKVLHTCIIQAIETSVNQCLLTPIHQMIVSGNTTMIHLFLDIPTTSLGRIPFIVPRKEMTKQKANTLFSAVKENFDVITLPHISAYVGSDIVCGVVTSNMDIKEEYTILIDLGTNGEIIAKGPLGLIATSAPAGPAFEGVGIRCGGSSIDGAITKVCLDNNQIRYQTIGDKPPICICGSGLVSLVSQLLKHQKINEMGRFIKKEDTFNLTKDIYITNKDLQTIQLAKAAVQAGVKMVLDKIQVEVTTIYIAGGFGSHLEIEDILRLKILPIKYQHQIKVIQNSAIGGAYVALLNQNFDRFQSIAENTQTIELASLDDFEDELLDSFYF